MNCCIVSSNAPNSILAELKNHLGSMGLLLLPPDCSVDAPVSCHPDMLMCIIGRNAVLPRCYIEKYPSVGESLSSVGYNVIPSDAPRGMKYPLDVSLNVSVGDGFIICRLKSTAAEIIGLSEKAGMTVIDVKQGYAGCSCVVSGKCVLSSDEGICAAAEREGLRSFYAPKEGILLPGYDCGFIGGCAGIHDGILYLTGVPEGKCMDGVLSFCAAAKLELCCLTDGGLYDIGGIKFL